MSISLKTQNYPSTPNQFFNASISDDRSPKLVALCVLFILCVSTYDTYLVAEYRNGIMVSERNPICLYLIRQDMSHLSWFIGGKVLGNLVVVSTLLGLYFSRFRYALTVTKSVALFQLMLLVYLQCSDSCTGFLHFDGLGSNVPSMFYPAVWSLLLHLVVISTMVAGGVFAKRKWEHVRS